MTVNPNEASRVLLVEGQDDKHMVWQLCRQRPASFHVAREEHDLSVTLQSNLQTFVIKETTGGQSDLLEAIRGEVEASGREALGVVLDTDQDLNKCWSNIEESFSRTTVQLPTEPSPTGTIVREQDDLPRVGIWLMPDNQSPGELEDFALMMMPRQDTIWPLSQSYIDNIPEGDRKFKDEKTDKAKLYAWLAARKEPGRMGAAVSTGDLVAQGSLCEDFFTWLVKLFG